MDAHCRRRTGPIGFTLIELLVSIAIMAVLISITLVVGASVVRSGKGRLTTDTIRSLDGMLSSYEGDHDEIPSGSVGHPDDVRRYNAGSISEDQIRQIPVADARWQTRGVMINSVGLFIAQIEAEGLSDMLGGFDPRMISVYSPEEDTSVSAGAAFPQLTTVFDAWKRPIRYVHPKFDGQIVQGTRMKGDPGNFVDVADDDAGFFYNAGKPRTWLGGGSTVMLRRNAITEVELETDPALGEQADGDGGLATSGRPYFYSAGEDGNPATRDDNVYTQEPRFIEQDL